MKTRHPDIRSLNKTGVKPGIHGTHVWPSSFMIMEYLETHPMEDGQRVMEIGCDWGLLGIFCAKHFPVKVLLTDADRQVFPYVDTHARLNKVQVRTEQMDFERIPDRRLREHDVLIGADICFWPELGTQLRRLVQRALSQDVGRIILADPGRSTFLRLADYCEHQFAATLTPWQTSGRAKSDGYLLVIGGEG
ncbi:class I SAM-dependent methyltransferase [Thiocystis violacea]|uniref:class I SAM-dependent methyltransferase n=1 Tax=Thiocystis violacea TaxID=13725 RepID=UPI001906AD94|nr:methyltransferase [Thiocystis violacea]